MFRKVIAIAALAGLSQATDIFSLEKGKQCTQLNSVGQCGNCRTSDQCSGSQYCCPFMKKCVANGSTACYAPIADCRPPCSDDKADSCKCNNKDYPEKWAPKTCGAPEENSIQASGPYKHIELDMSKIEPIRASAKAPEQMRGPVRSSPYASGQQVEFSEPVPVKMMGNESVITHRASPYGQLPQMAEQVEFAEEIPVKMLGNGSVDNEPQFVSMGMGAQYSQDFAPPVPIELQAEPAILINKRPFTAPEEIDPVEFAEPVPVKMPAESQAQAMGALAPVMTVPTYGSTEDRFISKAHALGAEAPAPMTQSVTKKQCVPKKSVGSCGNCRTSEQCSGSQFCCPFMKKCVANGSTPCYAPIADCRPSCPDSKAESCKCNNKDYPENWAGPTC